MMAAEEATTAVVDELTGFRSCYGCGKCTSGCPAAGRMDVTPHQVMRLLQLGRLDELISAGGPWACVGCQTCMARCPNGIDIPAALAGLRLAAIRDGRTEKAGNTPVFDELFLGMIRRRGRSCEGELMLRYRLKTGGLLNDWRAGLKMWWAGKLKFRTPGVQDEQALARLFEPAAATTEDAR
jgi:heterodisulfide reductase subunit C